MKELVRGAGVPTTEFRSLPDAANTTALTRIAGELSAPLIVKPASGYGSNTTEKVDDAAALGTVAGGLTFDMVQRSHQLIVEDYVTGEELCVDAVWSGEKALTFVVHKYLKPRMTVLDNGLDGSLILLPEDHPDLYGRLREMHARETRARHRIRSHPSRGVRAAGRGADLFRDRHQTGRWLDPIHDRRPSRSQSMVTCGVSGPDRHHPTAEQSPTLCRRNQYSTDHSRRHHPHAHRRGAAASPRDDHVAPAATDRRARPVQRTVRLVHVPDPRRGEGGRTDHTCTDAARTFTVQTDG
ncbi:ATP-grasp domain-containing protein [Salinispora arenicola]|uniref:ATP-grasp domain-containing protein n=1 Tax=Salinispora arenicola TaxID=168697 RepID=UPI0027DB2372|nr:ATP-grasp domain-containing protein [Salinispora arenicola]